MAAAIRELHEETQLVADKDIILQFCGKPFSFADHGIGRSWTVHPFGWFLKAAEEKIEIDWEHSGWEWVKPARVLSGEIMEDCVPNLDRSLGRVYFGPGGVFPGESPLVTKKNKAGKAFVDGLERLKNDKENGARVLATEAVRCIQQIVKDIQDDFKDEKLRADGQWWTDIRTAAYHLIYSARPSMNAAISSAVLRALKAIVPILSSDSNQSTNLSQVSQLLEASISDRARSPRKLSDTFKDYVMSLLPSRSETRDQNPTPTINILTLSSSSTIRTALLRLLTSPPDLRLSLSILESRPLCEGASLASSLIASLDNDSASSRLHVTIAPDTHLAQLLGNSPPTILLLGADRISPSGHVCNKTGSLPAAVVTRTISPNTRIVVLSEADKIARPERHSSPPSSSEAVAVPENAQVGNAAAAPLAEMRRETRVLGTEEGDPDEVSRFWPQEVQQNTTRNAQERVVSVEVKNTYFEWIPSQYIDVYISDDGILTKNSIRAKSEEVGRLEEEILGSLYGDEEGYVM